MARNKYPGYCYCCGKWVVAGKGYPEWNQGEFYVRCAECAHKKQNFNKQKDLIFSKSYDIIKP